MGDLDLSELWDGTQLEKIAEESGYDAEVMTSKLLEDLADHDDWLGQDEEADDYSDEIAALAKRTCEQYDQEDSGAHEDSLDEDEDEGASLDEDEESSLDEDEAAVLHSLLERKGADAVLKAVRSQQEEFDGAELSWKWSLKDDHGNSGWVRQLRQGVKRSAEAVDNSGEDEDEDEAEDEPRFKRARNDRMREHEYADYDRWRQGR